MDFSIGKNTPIENVKEWRKAYNNLLFDACIAGRLDIIKQLVIYDVNIHYIPHNPSTPLINACQCNHVEIVDFLIGLGCDVNRCNDYEEPPLLVAINCINNKKNDEIITLLLKNGAKINDLEKMKNIKDLYL